MSKIDEYLNKLFGKLPTKEEIKKKFSTIPDAYITDDFRNRAGADSRKLFLKMAEQVFSDMESRGISSFTIDTLNATLTPGFIKNSALSPNNFSSYENTIPENQIHPECMIVIGDIIGKFIDTYETSPDNLSAIIKEIVADKSDDKYVKTLKKIIRNGFSRTGTDYSIEDSFDNLLANLNGFKTVGDRKRGPILGTLPDRATGPVPIPKKSKSPPPPPPPPPRTPEPDEPREGVPGDRHGLDGLDGPSRPGYVPKIRKRRGSVAIADGFKASAPDDGFEASVPELRRGLGLGRRLGQIWESGPGSGKGTERVERAHTKYIKQLGGSTSLNKDIIDQYFSLIGSTVSGFITYDDLRSGIQYYLNSSYRLMSDLLCSYNIDKLLSKILKKNDEKPSEFFKDDANTKRKFIRKNGELYEIKSGTETKVDEFNFDSNSGLLPSVGITNPKTSPFHTVSDYYMRCLRGEKITSDRQCYDVDFTTARDDLDKMKPANLKLILSQFKIPTHLEYDEISRTTVLKVKDYDDWIKEVVNKEITDTATLGIITGNNSLKQYIMLLTSYFNEHLSLLNPNYQNTIEDGEYLQLGPLGIPKILYRKGQTPQIGMMSKADFHRVLSLVYYNNDVLQNKLRAHGILTGGGSSKTTIPEVIKPVGELLEIEIKRIEKSLESMGKKIREEDTNTIKKLIQELKDKESKLFTLHNYISEYNDHLTLYGPQSDGQLVLSIDNLIKFIDLYKDKQKKILEKQSQAAALVGAAGGAL